MQNEIINEIRNMTRTLNKRMEKIEKYGYQGFSGYKHAKSLISLNPTIGNELDNGNVRFSSKTSGLTEQQIKVKRNALKGLINDTRNTITGINREIASINSNFTKPVIPINRQPVNAVDNIEKKIKPKKEWVMDRMIEFFNSEVYSQLVEEFNYDSEQLARMAEFLIDSGKIDSDELIGRLEDLYQYAAEQDDDFDTNYFIYQTITDGLVNKADEDFMMGRRTYYGDPDNNIKAESTRQEYEYEKEKYTWKTQLL